MLMKRNKFILPFILGVIVAAGLTLFIWYALKNNLLLATENNNIAEFNTIDSALINQVLTFQSTAENADFSTKIKKTGQKQNTELLNAIEMVKEAQDQLYIAISDGQQNQGMEQFIHEISPTYQFPELYLKSLAYAYLSAGYCLQSAQLYQKLIIVYPLDFSGYFGKAISYQACQENQKAIQAYHHALAVFPTGNGQYNFIIQQINSLSVGSS